MLICQGRRDRGEKKREDITRGTEERKEGERGITTSAVTSTLLHTDYPDAPIDQLGAEETLLSPRHMHIRRGSVSSVYDVLAEELGR